MVRPPYISFWVCHKLIDHVICQLDNTLSKWTLRYWKSSGMDPMRKNLNLMSASCVTSTGKPFSPLCGVHRSPTTDFVFLRSKFMCVDDRRIICGSANLNDRSQRGDRDSEIAVCIEDDELIPSTMNGKPYMAGKVTSAWRRKLMRGELVARRLIIRQYEWLIIRALDFQEHLGLMRE